MPKSYTMVGLQTILRLIGSMGPNAVIMHPSIHLLKRSDHKGRSLSRSVAVHEPARPPIRPTSTIHSSTQNSILWTGVNFGIAFSGFSERSE